MPTDVSNLLNYWTSGVFSRTGPLVIWCVVLIVVGFKGVKYRKKMMVTGVWFYALSIAIPVLQYVLYEFMVGSSPRGTEDAFLRHTGIIIGVLTQLAAAASVAYPLLAIFTSGKSSHAEPDSDTRVEVDTGSEGTASER
jgi:hypothetical protein